MADRYYVCLSELIEETGAQGFANEAVIMRFLKSASDFIDREFKAPFIPFTETRTFDGTGTIHKTLSMPVISISALTQDGISITNTQYNLYPLNKWWANGCYTRLTIDPDATELSYWTCEKEILSITGQWGLYSETVSTGATVNNTTSISNSGISLLASNGALVSPGMLLLVESEQVLVEATGSATDSTVNTAEALDATEEEIDLTDGTLVNVGEIIRIDFEQMKILDIKTNTAVVVRGWNGTTKTTHANPSDVYVYRTYTVKRGVNGTTAAAHLNGVSISRYVAPPEIRYLATETAVMRLEKAKTKYAGRQGSVELGETFYFADFPKTELEQVKRQFRIPVL